jgi:hypothetical protein
LDKLVKIAHLLSLMMPPFGDYDQAGLLATSGFVGADHFNVLLIQNDMSGVPLAGQKSSSWSWARHERRPEAAVFAAPSAVIMAGSAVHPPPTQQDYECGVEILVGASRVVVIDIFFFFAAAVAFVFFLVCLLSKEDIGKQPITEIDFSVTFFISISTSSKVSLPTFSTACLVGSSQKNSLLFPDRRAICHLE